MTNFIGKSIGRYHILEQLGQGGMATVYKAYDTRLEREVAIKLIRKDAFPAEVHDRVLQRFDREAKSLAKLSHPNIVKVYDYGEYEGAPYLVMELIDGGSLKEYTGQPIPYQEAAQILLPIARALSYAHERKILHRDIKPGNILVSQSGEVILTDFGIAKLLENSDGQTLTGMNVGIGTPEYMAPEQGLGKDVNERADIYALGVVFYELITGHKPYTADTPMAVVIKQINDPLPRPGDYIGTLPDNVEHVIVKALAKNQNDRFPDMNSFSQALKKLISEDNQSIQYDLTKSGREKIVQDVNPDKFGQQVSADTIDEFSTGTVKSNLSDKPGKYRVLIIGLITITLIVVGIVFGYQKKRQSDAVKMEVVTNPQEESEGGFVSEIISTEIEETKTPVPTSTNEIPAFSIDNIPVFDSFDDNDPGDWYVTNWSDLDEYLIVQESGILHITASGGSDSKYKAMFYYLSNKKPIKAFFASIHVNKIENGIASLTFTDRSNWYNFAAGPSEVSIDGADIPWRKISGSIAGKTVWFGVVVEDGEVLYYLDNQLVAKTDIVGAITTDEIGFEIGGANNGIIDIEIDEVRILFDE